MKYSFLIYILKLITTVISNKLIYQNSDIGDDPLKDNAKKIIGLKHVMNQSCWMSMNAKQHFQIMDDLDENYQKIRSDYQKELGEEFDKKMLDTLLAWRGVAMRESFKTGENDNQIPAGLNLGGYCMMKMKNSVLFFHRIKLRNQTHFRVNFLHTDVESMTLVMQLSLNDLHLLGAYERLPVDKNPSVLYYAPTFGEVEFLLKNVDYKMEARLRLLTNRLVIDLVTSALKIEDILMMFTNLENNTKPMKLIKDNIEDFLDRMKTDLDKWLKDYFNDYLTYFGSIKTPSQLFLQAEKEKLINLNEYADSSLHVIRKRIQDLGADTVKIPHFTIYGSNDMSLKLKDGVLRGLDSIYRRSVISAKKENNIRKVNFIVGFSTLKVMYKYEASLRMDMPPLSGIIVLSADEVTAHMEMSLVKDPETVDLDFDFIQQMKPESLTVEGPASKLIANFKHLLEHHIIAIMSNIVVHNIKMLKTLSRCEPMLLGENNKNRFSSLSKMNEKANLLNINTKSDSWNINSQSETDSNKISTKYNHNSEIKSMLHHDSPNTDTDNPGKKENIYESRNYYVNGEKNLRYSSESSEHSSSEDSYDNQETDVTDTTSANDD